jgi:hypothetical protein
MQTSHLIDTDNNAKVGSSVAILVAIDSCSHDDNIDVDMMV